MTGSDGCAVYMTLAGLSRGNELIETVQDLLALNYNSTYSNALSGSRRQLSADDASAPVRKLGKRGSNHGSNCGVFENRWPDCAACFDFDTSYAVRQVASEHEREIVPMRDLSAGDYVLVMESSGKKSCAAVAVVPRACKCSQGGQ